MPRKSGPYCGDYGGTKNRTDEPCTQSAGWGTHHPGEGRCKLHGGQNVGNGHAIKHGRYAQVNAKNIMSYAEYLEANDKDPLDTLPDLLLARASLINLVNELDELNDALLRWHASFQKDYKEAWDAWRESMINKTETGDWADMTADDIPPAPDPLDFVNKPRKVLDQSIIIDKLDTITKLVERTENNKLTKAITKEVMQGVTLALKERMELELTKALKPKQAEKVKAAVVNAWNTMKLDTKTGKVLEA